MDEGVSMPLSVDRIRRGEMSDAEMMSQIAEAAYAQYVEAIGRPPAPMTADYATHLQDDHCLIALIGRNEQSMAVGFVVIVERSDGYWIETVAVLPEFTGQGIGANLVEAAEAFVATSADAVQLYTNAKMTRNLSWYPRLGYHEVDRRREQGFDRVFFHKQLG